MKQQTKPRLGRGLDALMISDDIQISGTSSISDIALSQIQANPDQPRTVFDQEALDELSTSIKNIGLIQPITLREIGENKYQIISGERRYRASKMAGLETIPAYIKKASDESTMEMALIENIQREDLNPIEIALAFQNLIEIYDLTQDRLSERIGKKRATIANFLRLLKLPAEIQIGLKDKKIDMGHAKAILGVNDTASQLNIYEQILKNNFSVRKTEEIIRQLNEEGEISSKQKHQNTPKEFTDLKEVLSQFFGTKVQFSCNEKGHGKISISFKSDKELERIMVRFDSLKK